MPLSFLHETCHSERSEESRTSEEEFLSVLFFLKEKRLKISRHQLHDEPLPARVRFRENNYQKYDKTLQIFQLKIPPLIPSGMKSW
jgi:hypothetical protein